MSDHERITAYLKPVHDVGGEPDAPMKYENKQYELWEHMTYVTCEVLGWRGIWLSEERRRMGNVDVGRAEYLGLPYYARWLLAVARRPVVVPCGPQLREVLALADVGLGLAEVIHLERLRGRGRPAVHAVGGEVGHQLDDLIGCSGRHEVECELGAHGPNVSAVSPARGKLRHDHTDAADRVPLRMAEGA